jgi:hypothetical protein
MSTNGTAPTGARDRRTSLIVALAIALALVVFLAGYLFGRGSGETASPSVSTSLAPSPTEAPPSPSVSVSSEPSPSPTTTEPTATELPDDTYFVQLADLQGGEAGPPVVVYDLAYFLTGQQADQEAAARGMETPVPNGYFIVNDNPKLRTTPLSETFSVKYIPEGSGLSTPVKAHQSQFLGWLGGSVQTDFPPVDTSWWWITIDNGEITTIKQQYLP